MFRLLCGVFVMALVISLLGCGGGKPGKTPTPGINPNPTPRPVNTTPPPTPKPEPSPEEKWLADTCGQCHPKDGLKDLKDKVMAMTTADLEAALRTKCLPSLKDKPGVTFTEDEIKKALEIHSAAKAKQAEKAAGEGTQSTPPPSGVTPSGGK